MAKAIQKKNELYTKGNEIPSQNNHLSGFWSIM